jgi:anthranilate phosphoribosyltransferase
LAGDTVVETLKTVTSGRQIPRDEARRTVRAMFEDDVGDALIAGLLVALKMKGESAQEIAGFAEGMRDVQVSIEPGAGLLVDTCGTGGDGKGTFNISTAAAIIAAAAGVPVAKHGNRGVSSTCGSADVLRELGVDIEMSPERVTECIERVGIGFLFAPTFHPAMRHVMGARRSLGVPTIFNILGPLTNPAGAKAQVIGVSREELVGVIGEVLCELDAEHAFVLHGADGMDEFSLASETVICEVRSGEKARYVLAPEDLGFARCAPGELEGGGAAENAAIIRGVLAGESGPRADICAANAAFALVAGRKACSPADGVRLARRVIDDGSAMRRLEMLVEFSGGAGGEDVPR